MQMLERNRIVQLFGKAHEWARERLVRQLIAGEGHRLKGDVLKECEDYRSRVAAGLSALRAYAKTLETAPFKTIAATRLGESALRMLEQLCDAVEDET